MARHVCLMNLRMYKCNALYLEYIYSTTYLKVINRLLNSSLQLNLFPEQLLSFCLFLISGGN